MTRSFGNNPRLCWTVVWQVGSAIVDDPTCLRDFGGGSFRAVEDSLVGLWVVSHEVPPTESEHSAIYAYLEWAPHHP